MSVNPPHCNSSDLSKEMSWVFVCSRLVLSAVGWTKSGFIVTSQKDRSGVLCPHNERVNRGRLTHRQTDGHDWKHSAPLSGKIIMKAIIKGNIVRYFLQYAIFSPLIKYLPFDLPVELWPKFYLDLLLSVDLLFDIWHTFWPTFLLLSYFYLLFANSVCF